MLTSKDYLKISRALFAIRQQIPETLAQQRKGDHQLRQKILQCMSAAAGIGVRAEREEKAATRKRGKKKTAP